MAGRISTRISLRWVPDEPEELTDTLVFNVGAYFMDLRVLKKDQSIHWGMAGERQILSEKPLKCRWVKQIDSLGMSGESDEGSFEKLPNGDDLETGSMPCPHKNNTVTSYEEVFQELSPRPGPNRAWIIQSVDGLKFLGRVAGSYMALAQQRQQHGQGDDRFTARSEEWGDDGRWNIKYAIGEVDEVPSIASAGSAEFEGEAGWKFGDKVSVLGNEYIVRGFEDL